MTKNKKILTKTVFDEELVRSNRKREKKKWMRIDYTGIGYLSRERAMVDFNSQSVEKEHTSAP